MLTISCFHAHYSNIALVEEALSAYAVELVHYVDPGLDRLKHDEGFSDAITKDKVSQTLHWIERCHTDAILVTCTLFAAVLQQEARKIAIPVIGIDDPLLAEIQSMDNEYIFAFTNPATVEVTMARVYRALQQDYEKVPNCVTEAPQPEAVCIPETFQLIMRGDKEGYLAAVREGLQYIAGQHPGKTVVAAQLSMAPAAALVQADTGIAIHSPLALLATYLEKKVGMAPK
ncbi:hypothetical protein MH215_25720 [Paenibacillus sp. ACRSA]|uniref:hypothetical protein n=1 Tax=Paenibacillus sp. ACRSA TaxID=2918211 RepID=UPI001EF5CCDC|nr:hypothetical protein [Paenibacillus sp. ACRSA]MCG7380380.1 hypothetical protein [Paenibacillus sp. ACRSA]